MLAARSTFLPWCAAGLSIMGRQPFGHANDARSAGGVAFHAERAERRRRAHRWAKFEAALAVPDCVLRSTVAACSRSSGVSHLIV